MSSVGGGGRELALSRRTGGDIRSGLTGVINGIKHKKRKKATLSNMEALAFVEVEMASVGGRKARD